METEALRWFQLVGDGMTVTEVSDIFMVSQPAVSRALARLEDEVGTPLLRRSGRVLRLTHAGAAFKAHVDGLVSELDDGLAAVHQLVDPDSGVVSLGYPLSLGTWFVPDALAAFRRQRPQVTFDLHRTTVGPIGSPSSMLGTRRIDLEITSDRVHGRDVSWARLAVERLLLAVPADHRLAGMPQVALADVATEPFILRRAPSGMRNLVLDLCASAGFEPRIAYDVDDLPTVHGFVAAGLGVAVVPPLGPTVPLRDDVVALIPLADPDARRTIGLAWRSDGGRLAAAEGFRRFLLARAAETAETAEGAAPR